MPQFGKYALLVGFLFICMASLTRRVEAASFTRLTYPGRSSPAHADLNNDGREDFVYADTSNGGFFVKLSKGDGVYGAASKYTLPGAAHVPAIGIGDFNGDGKADLILVTVGLLYEFLNNGNGSFHNQATFSVPTSTFDVVVGDFNHDGHVDLAVEEAHSIDLWLGDGNASFTPASSTPVAISGYLLLGDFDADGKADVAIGDVDVYDTVQILYGDGTGHFPATSFVRRAGDHSLFAAADVNGDGKMDIVASTYYPTTLQHISVYYGNAARTWAETKIPISHCASSTVPPRAADVNGDGINDLIVAESDCGGMGTATRRIAVLTRKSGGGYNPDQIVYSSSSSSLVLMGMEVLRADRNTKPDITFSQRTSTPCSATYHYNLQVMLNTTSGNFPTCFAPNAFEGIHVCSPATGSTVSSPVHFQIGAAGQTPMRKVEVWVDGKKVVEQRDGFSHYTFLNKSMAISSGSHNIIIFAAGWDNWLEKKLFSLNVN
jgi:FG-GAP-like repeat